METKTSETHTEAISRKYHELRSEFLKIKSENKDADFSSFILARLAYLDYQSEQHYKIFMDLTDALKGVLKNEQNNLNG